MDSEPGLVESSQEMNSGEGHSRPPLLFNISCSRHFSAWLAEVNVSLAVSTYQTGELFLIGRQASGELSIFERRFNRCMGLCSNGQTLWLASLYQLWRLENSLAAGETLPDGFDRLYIPRVGYTTGDIDIHDMAIDADGRLVFVSTLLSCLATASDQYSLNPLWKPPFVSRLAAEDRCHLNGLAMQAGRPKYVTLCGRTDVVDGWRDCRSDGGCVMDVVDNSIVADQFSMPHSPRLRDDKLWLLDSGRGRFGFVDLTTGRFETVSFCPGFARGLALVGDYAVIGLSLPRRGGSFTGLELDQQLIDRNARPRCGLQIIDLRSGSAVHWLRIEGNIQELYDVVAIHDVTRPKALGFLTNEIQQHLFISPDVA